MASYSLFENAHRCSTRDINIGNSISNYYGSDAQKEATHESATYSYAPKCQPGTRTVVLEDLMKFIAEADAQSLRLAWLSGPAGGGKTCILRSLAQECLGHNSLAGSFFFSTESARDNADGFIATISHQLCSAILGFQERLLRKIANDPSIFTKSLDIQLQRLVFEPLEEREVQEGTGPKVLLVDGLDECRDSKQRIHVIRLLQALSENPVYPFVIIVASRPESDIVATFNQEALASIMTPFRLHGYDADEDILAYLTHELERIRTALSAGRGIPEGWPKREALELLVKMASGQFIFAATVIKYVENGKGHPQALLAQVLHYLSQRRPSSCTNPFAELDALYSMILSVSNPNQPLLRRLLHAVLEIWRLVETNSLLNESEYPGLGPSTLMLDTFFHLEYGTTHILFSQLGSLVHVPTEAEQWNPNGYIRFHHKSMEDYLKTPERSGHLFRSEADTAADFVIASIQHLQRWSHFLQPPIIDKAATFGALYLCVRFTWDQIPTWYDIATSELEVAASEKVAFDIIGLIRSLRLPEYFINAAAGGNSSLAQSYAQVASAAYANLTACSHSSKKIGI
ncbi:hypothetical protein H1R20_g3021, partial [Candolleomyces eurysporus]